MRWAPFLSLLRGRDGGRHLTSLFKRERVDHFSFLCKAERWPSPSLYKGKEDNFLSFPFKRGEHGQHSFPAKGKGGGNLSFHSKGGGDGQQSFLCKWGNDHSPFLRGVRNGHPSFLSKGVRVTTSPFSLKRGMASSPFCLKGEAIGTSPLPPNGEGPAQPFFLFSSSLKGKGMGTCPPL